MKHNNTPAPDQAARRLAGLLEILRTLDLTAFRIVTGADETIPADVLLKALHKARLEHPGVNRTQKQASRRYLKGDRNGIV